MPNDDREPVRADLMPSTIMHRCPTCGTSVDGVEVVEDEAGEHRVPDEERFVECECGELLDIGWAGWGWHDGSLPAREPETAS